MHLPCNLRNLSVINQWLFLQINVVVWSLRTSVGLVHKTLCPWPWESNSRLQSLRCWPVVTCSCTKHFLYLFVLEVKIALFPIRVQPNFDFFKLSLLALPSTSKVQALALISLNFSCDCGMVFITDSKSTRFFYISLTLFVRLFEEHWHAALHQMTV